MKRTIVTVSLLLATTIAAFPAVRVNVRLGAGHPLRRPARTVVVRPARPAVVVPARVTYVAPVVWTRAVVTAPGRDRLVWEDSETIRRNEDWVDSHFSVNNRGERLYLTTRGRAEVDFAEVYFENGQVQVVDFREAVLQPGTHLLLDFKDGRKVDSVRVIARARGQQAQLTVLMAK